MTGIDVLIRLQSVARVHGAVGGAVVAATVAFALAGCGRSPGGDATPDRGSSPGRNPALDRGSPSASAISGTVNVFAAASLTEAFTTLGKQFEAAHPGVEVVFNFGPSSRLAEQINQGAPADVFASASTRNMDQVVSAGGASNPTPFAKNAMEIATPPSNPGHVTGVNDLDKSNVKVALCQEQVPCGATTDQVFAKAKITVKPVTEEVDVKSVLSKVELGEVDAGVVYVTDVRAAGSKVKGVLVPSDVNASTTYPIAALTKSRNAAAARAFVAYVLSPGGTSGLTGNGFEKP